MKNKQKQALENLQQTVEKTIQLLDELEAALHEGDHRKIGASLYKLRRALQEAKQEAQP